MKRRVLRRQPQAKEDPKNDTYRCHKKRRAGIRFQRLPPAIVAHLCGSRIHFEPESEHQPL
jgi:hypothetical protein